MTSSLPLSLAMGLLLAFAYLAGLPPGTMAEQTHQGVVVTATAQKLVMTDDSGKNEHEHALDAAVTVTINGTASKADQLIKGDKVVVTTNNNDKVVSIAATRAYQ